MMYRVLINIVMNTEPNPKFVGELMDTIEDFKEACEQWFLESQYEDIVTCSKCHALTEKEI